MAATVPSHPPTPLLLLALLLLGLLSGGPGRPVVAVSAAGDPETAQESQEAVRHVAFVDVGLPSPPEDRHEKCPEWAEGGKCLANRPYMLENCAVSCKVRGRRKFRADMGGGSDPGKNGPQQAAGRGEALRRIAGESLEEGAAGGSAQGQRAARRRRSPRGDARLARSQRWPFSRPDGGERLREASKKTPNEKPRGKTNLCQKRSLSSTSPSFHGGNTKNDNQKQQNKAAGVRNEGRAYVLPGEDAAAAAFRFGEVHGGHYKRGTLPAPQAVEVAALLQARLDGDVPDYTPDVSVTHCGKRKCTAGKLWKRAEDYRKDELVSLPTTPRRFWGFLRM
ncbi:hypothetical protein THAOC_06208 [Thalassiosira oceanica]|uniref:ShKT domain-containing protein n=1 Tax=Thalassiosira oceanica TaxID=159749 RepID=K0TLY9_THAOC|nr:hypothetical protein THAOC_06208 [Thalassiosira oceanica]|eukprot:EJK72272.1 hypothetical protein THAOC_06208 [Thalassiosira oceanica]